MSKPFSSIGLKTFFEYSGLTPPRTVHLKQADFFLEGTGVQLPRTGHTFLYGYKTSRFVLGNAMARADSQNKEFCLVNAEARIGNWNPNKIRLDSVEEARFVNLPTRASRELLDDIQRKWEGLLKAHGLSPDADHFPRKPSPHMHLLDELIQMPPYDKLTCLAYYVESTLGTINVVTVFRPEDLIEIDVNSFHEVDVKFEFGPNPR